MLESFFIWGNLPATREIGNYQFPLVVLSYVVAGLASYTALSLGQQLTGVRAARERQWLHWGGAFAMGAGIWSMHFIGMLSYKMRMLVEYNPFITLCSMLIAVAFSYGVLELVARKQLFMRQIVLGGVLLGIGICSMHYTGMAAMEMDGDLRYTPGFFLMSVAIAMAASAAALWITFTLARSSSRYRPAYQTMAALVMGAAICGMHYTGMAAAVFIPYAECRYDPDQDFKGLALAVAAITGLILALAIAAGIYRKTYSVRALLAAIVESSDDAIISKTLDGIVTSWNAAAARMLGYTPAEAIGQHISFLIPPDRIEEEKQIITKIRAGLGVEHFETVRRSKDGRLIDLSLTVSPIYDANGHIIGASKVARDISERKEADARLMDYMRALERSNQELDDFAHIASHDLKEPLRGLHNHATFLMEDYQDKLDETGIRRLTRMTQMTKRMESLISDLLYFSQLGRTELAIQKTDPNALVEDIQQMLENFLKERNARIIVPKPLPVIVCDKPRVTEVFRNLITNAVKYNDKPERLVEVGFIPYMETPEGPERDVFYIRDNGIGIDPQFHQIIFRIFKRLNHDAQETGTGAGLTFVKKIIERHNGRIWLESEPGTGSTFYFNLKRGGDT